MRNGTPRRISRPDGHRSSQSWCCILCIVLSAHCAWPAPDEPVRSERQVGPGVTLISQTDPGVPVNLSILRVDLTNPNVHVETEKPGDRLFSGARTQDIAREESGAGHVAIGAVNGDFWRNDPRPFSPLGFFVSDGMIYNMPAANRSVFAILRDGRVYIGRLTLRISLTDGATSFPIPRINSATSTDTVVLFTPPFGEDIPSRRATYISLSMPRGAEFLPNRKTEVTVSAISQGHPLHPSTGTLVLAVPRDQQVLVSGLRKGTTVELAAEAPEVNGIIAYCIGGAPRIVRDGRVSVEAEQEHLSKNFATDRHPRTAVGVSRDGKMLSFVTADGRQPAVSVGQSLSELAEDLVRLGCWDAINLDGGGSTTMVVRGEVVNRPSDLAGPRTVANAIVIYGSAPPGPLAEIEVSPDRKPLIVPADTLVQFRASGFDANYNPIPLAPLDPVWHADRAIGEMGPGKESVFLRTCPESASGTLNIEAGGIAKQVQIQILPVDYITADPDVLLLASGEKIAPKVSASGRMHPLFLQPQMIELAPSTRAISVADGVVTARCAGGGNLSFRIGKAKTEVPYYVDRYRSVMLDSFDHIPTTATLRGANFDQTRSAARQELQNRKQGTGCLALQYAMDTGGTTKISLPISATIQAEPAKIGLWIFGDGKQAWVRAEMRDAAGRRFLLDFTEGSKGVYWKNQWRHVLVPAKSITPRAANPGAAVQFPATITELYAAQDQEALKATGTLLLDALEAIYPPK